MFSSSQENVSLKFTPDFLLLQSIPDMIPYPAHLMQLHLHAMNHIAVYCSDIFPAFRLTNILSR